MAYQTKSERVAAGQPVRDGPFEGVPPHLRTSLVALLRRFPHAHSNFFDAGQVHALERVTRVSHLLSGLKHPEMNFGIRLAAATEDQLLALLDAVLEIDGVTYGEQVGQMLDEAGSIFCVAQSKAGVALERRIPPVVEAAIADLKDARAHLEEARRLIFGRAPDYKKGLHECVSALEATSIPIAQPSNAKATLSHVIGELRANGTRYAADMPATIDLFVSLADSLWKLQAPHRHGAPSARAPDPVTREQAETAFWLVVTLCTWCERGHIRTI